MLYRVEDEDGDTDSQSFTIVVQDSDRHSSGIYWTNTSTRAVWRANLDGSQIQVVARQVRKIRVVANPARGRRIIRPEAVPEIGKRDRGHRQYFAQVRGDPHQENWHILN